MLETRTITVTQVDMTNHYVTGRDQYGTLLQVSWHVTDAMTSIPAMGEVWTVDRQGNQWFLDKRGDDGTETTSLTDLGPGDRRIDTSGNIYLNGASLIVNGSQYVPGATPGTLDTRPNVADVPSGSMYYAADQDVLYLNLGSAWQRLGFPAGGTLLWFSTAIPTGWVRYDGSSLPSNTGIYADLAAHLGGTSTPDTLGRMPVGVGTHSDVNALNKNDGVAASSRRPKHKHTVVQPTITRTADVGVGTTNGIARSYSAGSLQNAPANPGATDSHYDSNTAVIITQQPTFAASGGTVGPQTGAEPTDGSGYLTTYFIAKL